MTSMIEKVAAAMLKELISSGEYIKDLGDGLIKIDGCIDLGNIASVAIEALREPTEAMTDAAADEWVEDWRQRRKTIGTLWDAAIDAALKEQEKVG